MKNKNDFIWYDRKRHLGLPISFTKYYVKEDRLFLEAGLFTTEIEETLLYRIRDVSVKMTLFQKIFKVGTITVLSSDKSHPVLELKNVKNPRDVKEMLHTNIEKMKDKKRVRVGEIIDDSGCVHDDMNDEFNDDFEY